MTDASAILPDQTDIGEVSRRGFLRRGGAAAIAVGSGVTVPIASSARGAPALSDELLEQAAWSDHRPWFGLVLPIVRGAAMQLQEDAAASDRLAERMIRSEDVDWFFGEMDKARHYLRTRLAIIDAHEAQLKQALARRTGALA